MKNKRKKRFLIILLIIISPVVVLKTYFGVENAIYENSIGKMNLQDNLINSLVDSKVLNQDGYDLHYYVSGKKNSDLIVFLHPAYSDHRAFDQQIDFFSENYRIITIDLIGHGLSKTNETQDKLDASSRHIAEIIELEGYDSAHFVGVSLGSWIAQYFALNNPEKVKSLTALGGYDINKKSDISASVNIGMIIRTIFSIKSLRQKAAEMCCGTEKGKALFYNTASYYERKSAMVMPGIIKIMQDRERTETRFRTLILTGEYDLDSNKKMATEWDSKLTNSKLSILNGAGHCANIDKPQEFNEIVETFLNEINN
ncbi:alpha/beta fold hydrolase [Saccharicrinis aurantiacus]|uniref:alpha/beta fold hydrolase n=1 Tax=Saccharicrinis aurantiacus TaxID=1849719 RepID=UPI00249398CF|nr:alpha/beta hydrolase [Saccharicrinis aurantiacus]